MPSGAGSSRGKSGPEGSYSEITTPSPPGTSAIATSMGRWPPSRTISTVSRPPASTPFASTSSSAVVASRATVEPRTRPFLSMTLTERMSCSDANSSRMLAEVHVRRVGRVRAHERERRREAGDRAGVRDGVVEPGRDGGQTHLRNEVAVPAARGTGRRRARGARSPRRRSRPPGRGLRATRERTARQDALLDGPSPCSHATPRPSAIRGSGQESVRPNATASLYRIEGGAQPTPPLWTTPGRGAAQRAPLVSGSRAPGRSRRRATRSRRPSFTS